jgi:hypothetical protein
MELHWKYIQESKVLWGNIEHTSQRIWANSSSGGWTDSATSNTGMYYRTKPLTNFQMTGLRIAFPITNNSVFEVYDMKGSY